MFKTGQSFSTSVVGKTVGIIVAIYVVIVLLLMFIWDNEPDEFDVVANAHAIIGQDTRLVTGSITTATLIGIMDETLYKFGGYLSNDVTPPGVFMDNIPNWEFGVITQVRDMARALRNDFSRSQTQSTEDPDLAVADPQFHYDNESWILPSSEGEYKTGLKATRSYLQRLSDPSQQNAQFYARADNLRDWLAIVEKRLGSLSQRLSASVGQTRVNTDLQGDTAARQSTGKPEEVAVKTPWLEIDDVFYEARGSTWALIHFMKAVEKDFDAVLRKKNALVSLRQIIRELEATQHFVWSPMILNGTGFGFLANHSLVMGSYISRANAAVIDLRNLLEQG
ncbi:MAG: DUF2333 family protein [Gammaproteobacteria bacterium]|nr:DUF2333 family protein [Gammaproteobacteria bacterium]NIN62908.1 DUF2333 family protein [Gammaproteobacteria bacterium]NIO63889.1 DUF2333 family protein [Gammaproteobacteria bacterium]NIP50267.1 DUF2333 family protein [Gammaproteobacteria bacterium]NIQ12486.1 DUF2333 family protein [Gammaproteobacteria bacterium]